MPITHLHLSLSIYPSVTMPSSEFFGCLNSVLPFCSRSTMEYDSENLNSEEIYSSLRGVTEAIQNFSFRSQEDLMEPLRREVVVELLTAPQSASPTSSQITSFAVADPSGRRRGAV